MSDESAIDLVHLELIVEDDDGLLRELVTLYVADTRRRVAALAGVVDLERIRAEAHSLRGASANMGAVLVQGISEQLHEAAIRGDGAAARALISSLPAALATTEQVFARIVSARRT